MTLAERVQEIDQMIELVQPLLEEKYDGMLAEGQAVDWEQESREFVQRLHDKGFVISPYVDSDEH